MKIGFMQGRLSKIERGRIQSFPFNNWANEFTLAKKILKYDNFADQVKFARGGGEAMSIAVRLARAQTGKELIAFHQEVF